MEIPPVGGFCEDCGHFALRHFEDRCLWPDRHCECKGLLWQGNCWTVPDYGPPRLLEGK